MDKKYTGLLLKSFLIINCILFLLFLAMRSYPSPFIVLHVVSIVCLWIVILKRVDLVTLISERWQEGCIVVGLILLSLFVGTYQLEEFTPGMYPDELGVAVWGLKLNADTGTLPPFIGGGYSHPTPLLYLTGASVDMNGHNLTAIRLPSVILGALAVGLMYVLLRMFFPVFIALGGGILMTFQYTHVVLQRLAYESAPSLFFQLLTLIFLVLYWKRRDYVLLSGIALSIGAGLYTYLNFRPFAVLVILLTLFIIMKPNWRKHFREGLFFCALVFAAAMPLISYALIDTAGFWSRAAEISIFGRHYPPEEFFKELLGNMQRTIGFPFYGDPNPGKNPSGVLLFDPVTLVLAGLGLLFLWIKKRILFFITVLFLLPPFISDILSTEVIPEFHYYGLGHPNALRVSGLIPVVIFAAIYGLWAAYQEWGKNKIAESITVIGVIIGIISLLNWHNYFNQQDVHKMFYLYNYKYNHARIIKTAKHLNTTRAVTIGVSKELMEYGFMQFMLDPRKKLSQFEMVSSTSALTAIAQNDATAIALTQQTVGVVNEILDEVDAAGYKTTLLHDPLKNPDIVIFEK